MPNGVAGDGITEVRMVLLVAGEFSWWRIVFGMFFGVMSL